MIITIDGLTRDERLRVLELIRAVIQADGVYANYFGDYPTSGNVSREGYDRINHGAVFQDMSIGACMERYVERRERILLVIESGRASASMSGIEYSPMPPDEEILEAAFTWNGVLHISRPEWKSEYAEWIAKERLLGANFYVRYPSLFQPSQGSGS